MRGRMEMRSRWEPRARAIAQTLRWADGAAREGDLSEALAWLCTLELAGYKLPDEYELKREWWRARVRARSTKQGRESA